MIHVNVTVVVSLIITIIVVMIKSNDVIAILVLFDILSINFLVLMKTLLPKEGILYVAITRLEGVSIGTSEIYDLEFSY